MGFHPDMAYMDCPWCGLRDADMRYASGTFTTRQRGAITAAKEREYTPLSCPRCGGVVVIETDRNSNQILGMMPAAEFTVDVAALPERVEKHFAEATRHMRSGEHSAAAVSLRRTLEAAAKASGYDSQGQPLVQKVRAMIDDGLVTRSFAPALDHVRKVGNVGAHDSDEDLSEAEIDHAFRFTTQFLMNLFEIPAALAALDEPAPSKAASGDPPEPPPLTGAVP